jgi:cobalt-zinc-cadmium efflux system protein
MPGQTPSKVPEKQRAAADLPAVQHAHSDDAGHEHAHHEHERHGHAHESDHDHDHDRDHDHDHDHIDPASGTKVLAIAFALTAGFMLVELTGAWLADSLALMADAGHMLTDAAALALAWAAITIASRPADARRSFGYQRLRVLATFINGCALLFIVAWIAFEAVQRILHPVPVDGRAILWIGSLGLIVNLVVFAMLRRGDAHDMNVSAAMLHVLGDLLGSVAAIASGIVIVRTGWAPIDPILSLFVSALIVRSAWALVKRSAHILLEGSPDWLDQHALHTALKQHVPAIRDVHHVHCWQVGPNDTLLTMHAAVDPGVDHSTVLRQANAILAKDFGITHATIQIEDRECMDADCGPGAIPQAVQKQAASAG